MREEARLEVGERAVAGDVEAVEDLDRFPLAIDELGAADDAHLDAALAHGAPLLLRLLASGGTEALEVVVEVPVAVVRPVEL